MRRIMLLVTVALVTAAMMVMTASPAFAFPEDTFPPSQAQGPSENAFGGFDHGRGKHPKTKAKPKTSY